MGVGVAQRLGSDEQSGVGVGVGGFLDEQANMSKLTPVIITNVLHKTRLDIDNRLKTLFDALKVPSSRELLSDAEPVDDETPFFCLLQAMNRVSFCYNCPVFSTRISWIFDLPVLLFSRILYICVVAMPDPASVRLFLGSN